MIKHRNYKDNSSEKIAELNTIIQTFGNPPIEYVSNMTQIKSTPKSKLLAFYPINPESYDNIDRYTCFSTPIDNNSQDAPIGGLYFFLSRGKTPFMTDTTQKNMKCSRTYKFSSYRFSTSIIELLKIINIANNTNYVIADVYGVPVNTLKSLQKNNQWTNIFDLARKSLSYFNADVQFLKNWQSTEDLVGIKQLLSTKSFTNRVLNLDKTSQFRNILEPIIIIYNKFAPNLEITNSINNLDCCINEDISREYITNGKSYLNDNCFSDYPMLSLLDPHKCDSELDIIFNYIKQIDRNKI